MRPARGGVLLVIGLLVLMAVAVVGKGGARVRSSRSRSSSSSSSTRTRRASRSRTSSGQYRAQPQSGCRTCYYNSATGNYYQRNYYMFYGGHYFYCYSCGRQQTRSTCDPDTCSCDEGERCDPVDPNSMTMTVPAVSGSATVMLDPRVWSHDVVHVESEAAFNFTKIFAADMSAALGVTQPASESSAETPEPSSDSVVQPDAVAIQHILRLTTDPVSLEAVFEALTVPQQKVLGMREDVEPLWVTVEFTILVIDLENSGRTTTPETMITTLQSNCDSRPNPAFDGYLLWGCLSDLTETTYELQSQIGDSTGDAGVITIGLSEIFVTLLSCIGCCYCTTRYCAWKDQKRYTRARERSRAERQRQAEEDATTWSASSTPATVDAVSVVSAVPIEPTPAMPTAVATAVSSVHVTATAVPDLRSAEAPVVEPNAAASVASRPTGGAAFEVEVSSQPHNQMHAAEHMDDDAEDVVVYGTENPLGSSGDHRPPPQQGLPTQWSETRPSSGAATTGSTRAKPERSAVTMAAVEEDEQV